MYVHISSTKPPVLSLSLSLSPVQQLLLAGLVEALLPDRLGDEARYVPEEQLAPAGQRYRAPAVAAVEAAVACG